MARPTKQGLDYFPLDVGFLQDMKIRRLMKACGPQSIPVLISLLCSIYRDEGYYIGWDKDMPFLVADEVGASEGAVSEIVNKAIQIDIFNSDIFEKFSILTSAGIQRRFFKAAARRNEIRVRREILLISVSECRNLVFAYINSVNVCNNSINVDRNEQRKEKESKEKKSKAKKTQMPAPELPVLSDTVLNACRKLCGGLGPSQYEELSELVEIHGEQRVLEALRTAGRRGHRRLAYAAGILKNWRKDGYDGIRSQKPAGQDQEKRNTGAGDIERYRNITGL